MLSSTLKPGLRSGAFRGFNSPGRAGELSKAEVKWSRFINSSQLARDFKAIHRKQMLNQRI